MKSLRRNLFVAAASALCIAVFFVAVSLAGGAKRARAERGGDDQWVNIGEIYNDSTSRFKAGELGRLYQALAGSDVTTIEGLESAMTGGSLTSKNFRAQNSGKNVSVSFGGMKWDAVYLTKAKTTAGDTKEGDIILDLWRSADDLKSTDKAQYHTWRANTPSFTYPSNMYSTSKIRVDTLNAGGQYSQYGGSALEEKHEQDDANQYARFTMSTVANSVTKYLAKPSEVGYQADEWDEATANSYNSNKYYFPNDAYGAPKEGGQWYNNDCNYLDNNRDGGRAEGAKYKTWQDDYVWLPSMMETGRVNDTGDGIWDTDTSLRSTDNTHGQGFSYCWLRSGHYAIAFGAYQLGPSGASNYRSVDNTYGVRPALHFNLTRASAHISGHICENGTFYEALNSEGGALPAGSYYLSGDVELDNNITITGEVKLCLNGYMLKENGGGSVITVNGGSLTLCDCCEGEGCADAGHQHSYESPVDGEQKTVYGGLVTGGKGSYGGGVYVDNGTCTMEGGTISGNIASYYGGGVYLSSGEFTMANGKISGNTASYYGGGVYLSSGKFTMTSGKISENKASSGGGGVYLSGEFTMEGGTISGNTASSGGGVYLSGEFTMANGKISGNTASYYGGGVYVDNGEFTMTNGEISGNTASNSESYMAAYGGGVYVSSGTFTMEGGEISDNKAKTGGGVSLYNITSSGNPIFTMRGGTISGNEATSGDGGGVYIFSRGTFTLTSGKISENKASSGGGVRLVGGMFTMEGGTISGNTASSGGGGVYLDDYYGTSTFMMKEGEISGNTATSYYGGGVYVSSGTFTMEGGEISDNKAKTGGGVSLHNTTSSGNPIFTMRGGSISGNEATSGDGGGVYIYSYSGNPQFIMNSGTISENRASSGGGVYVYNGELTMSGGTISENTASRGGGVYLSSGTFNVSGSPQITGNTQGETPSPSANNVQVGSSEKISVTGALDEAARISVTLAPEGAFTLGAAENGGITKDNFDQIFLSDTGAECQSLSDGEVNFYQEHDWNDWGEMTGDVGARERTHTCKRACDFSETEKMTLASISAAGPISATAYDTEYTGTVTTTATFTGSISGGNAEAVVEAVVKTPWENGRAEEYYLCSDTFLDVTYSEGGVATATTVPIAVSIRNIGVPTADERAFTYNGKAQTYTLGGVEERFVTVKGNTQTAAGSYEVTAALNDTVNCAWATGGTEQKTYPFLIGKATLTVGMSAEVEYGEDAGAGNVTLTYVSGAAESDDEASLVEDAKAQATFAFGGYRAGTPVSETPTVTAAGELGNYFVKYNECTLVITQREIKVKLTFHGKIYGDAIEGWVSEEPSRADGKAGAWYAETDGDDVSVLGLSYSLNGTLGEPTNKTAADTYTVVPACRNGNYSAVFEYGDGGAEYTVSKASVTAVWSDADDRFYSGSAFQDPKATAEGVAGDELSLKVTLQDPPAEGFKNVGEYLFAAEIEGTLAGNYLLGNDTVSIRISPASLTAVWSGSEKDYTYTYGDTPSPSARVEGLGRDVLTATVAERDGKTFRNVGTYTYEATLEGDAKENYTLSNPTRSYSIVRARLTAELVASVVYGDEIGAENVTVTISADQLQNGDDKAEIERLAKAGVDEFIFRYSAGATHVGDEADVSAREVELENYAVSFTAGKIYVEKRVIGLTLSGERANVYGDEAHGTIRASAARHGGEGPWFGDLADEAKLNDELAYTFKREGASAAEAYSPDMPAGSYTIVAAWKEDSALARDYELAGDPASAEYTVRKALLTVKAKAHTVTYGQAPANSGVEYEGFVCGEGESVLGGALDYSYSYAQYGDAGEYSIMPKGLTSSNYRIVFVAGPLTVEKKAISVTIEIAGELIYGNVGEISATLGGVENGDDVHAAFFYEGSAYDGTFSAGSEMPTHAGEYTVSASLDGSKAGNYSLIEEGSERQFSIERAEYDMSGVTFAPLTVTYDGGMHDVLLSGRLPEGVEVRYAGNGQTDAGVYTVTATFTGDGDNFGPIASISAVLTIEKAGNVWTRTLSMEGWKIGKKANEPFAEAKFGEVIFTYSREEDGTYTAFKPTDAGTYWVKATVADTENYSGLEAKVSFKIEKDRTWVWLLVVDVTGFFIVVIYVAKRIGRVKKKKKNMRRSR